LGYPQAHEDNGGDDIQQVLVVQPGSELGRADQVAKQHGQTGGARRYRWRTEGDTVSGVAGTVGVA
jgi:hypothetical protein